MLDALGGEQAICSGCDICEGGEGNENFLPPGIFDAADANHVFNFIRKNRNYYGKNETLEFVKRRFNERERKIFEKNIWTTGDVEIILEQLQKSGAIYNASPLWKYKLSARNSLKSLPPRQKNRRLIRLPQVSRVQARAKRHEAS